VAKNPEHYAIVIGIDNYSQLPPIKSAVTDALSFTDWLKSASGGGLHEKNIRLIISQPTPAANPLDARPQAIDVEAALDEIVKVNQAGQIKRLYFYFAGHGYGPSFDDVGMLMANASLNRLHSIKLLEYRQFLRESGLFAEMMFVLDCSRVYLLDGAAAPPPTLNLPQSEQYAGASDFILMAASHGEKAFEVFDEPTGGGRGLLTKAVLEGLRGEAIDAWGRVTALSLSNYLRWRVPKLAGGASIKQVPEILLPTDEMLFVASTPKSKQLAQGTLVVEVPHWAAAVRIYDNCFRSLSVSEIEEDPKSSGLYISETKLPQGIYRVEINLEGKTSQQLVSVTSDKVSRITRASWTELKIDSAAPLEGTTTTHGRHMNAAANWSRNLTWKDGPGGASRLFLFVSTPEPKRYKRFAEGLRLLDADGKLVTDFSSGVEKNKQGGWMAFCADLHPGFYMLRRGRPGIRVRYQPLFLCAKWQTQVFLKARTSPSLRTLTFNMAEYKKGFAPEDETAMAAEAVLESMRYGTGGKRLVTEGKLNTLLRGKFNNPWLGILAAYALLSEEEIAPTATTRAVKKSNADLLQQVMSFLSTIKDHPDVRALQLKEKKKAEPFPYPPLLYAGLKLVQRHATQFAETIPLGSLTDRILDELVVNSPWTAWKEIEADEASEREVMKIRQRRRATLVSAEPPVSTAAAAVLHSVAPKAPVFQLFDAGAQQGTLPSEASSDVGTIRTASATAALNSAQLINVAQGLTRNNDLDALLETVPLGPTRTLNVLLNQLDAKDVSASSGLPLSRVKNALEELIESSQTLTAPPTAADAEKPPLSSVQQFILEYALKLSANLDPQTGLEPVAKGDKKRDSAGKHEGGNAQADASPVNESASKSEATPSISIEECAFKIRSEADRILLKYEGEGAGQVKDGEEQAQHLAERLRRVVARLLERAAFTAITDTEGRILSVNGAFDALLGPFGSIKDKTAQARVRQENQRVWEVALAGAPLGSSMLINPVAEPAISPGLKNLLLRRTAMEDDTKTVHAYLNALRSADLPGVKPATLQRIDELLPDLSLYASFFAYDTTQRLKEHAQRLEELAAQLEQLASE
jgi:hypothetical protein